MRTTLRTTATVLAFTLAACSGGGNSGSSGGGVVPATVQPPASLESNVTGIDYGAEALKGAAYSGASRLSSIDIGVLVKQRDAPGLLAYARSVSDPQSALYRHFLTPAEVADRFGASAQDYAAVAKYFTSRGIAVMGWKQRELLRVRGSQKAMEAALGARFGEYTRNGRTFHSLTGGPAALVGLPIRTLVGTTNYARFAQKPVKLSLGVARTGYSAPQVAAAFDYAGAYRIGYTGAGINVGIIGTGPIDPLDLSTYKTVFHVPGVSTVTQVNVTTAGGNAPLLGPPLTFGPPPPTTDDTCNIPTTGPDATCNPEDGEAQIDTQQVAGLARDANVFFYLGYAPNYDGLGDNAEGIQLADYEVQQAISDNRVDMISMSYGAGELDDVGFDFVLGPNGKVDPARSIGPVQFATLAALGITSFASSGDSGATECARDGNAATENDRCVSYPATDENVVAIGGVNAPLAANGRFVGPITGWGIQTNAGASGGGASAYFPAPAYQVGVTGVVGSTRNTPDVSLDGDSFTGIAALVNARYADGGFVRYGGTSVSAPETAAMWALVLQACKANPTACHANAGTGGVSYRFGNPNPLFYKIYANKAQYAATFFDVIFGNNSQPPNCSDPSAPNYPCPQPNPTLIPGYSATTGYDRVTGLGVPFGRELIKAIAGV